MSCNVLKGVQESWTSSAEPEHRVSPRNPRTPAVRDGKCSGASPSLGPLFPLHCVGGAGGPRVPKARGAGFRGVGWFGGAPCMSGRGFGAGGRDGARGRGAGQSLFAPRAARTADHGARVAAGLRARPGPRFPPASAAGLLRGLFPE